MSGARGLVTGQQIDLTDRALEGDDLRIDGVSTAAAAVRERGLVRERLLGAKVALAVADVLAVCAILIVLGAVLLGDVTAIGRTVDGPVDAVRTLVVVGALVPPVWSKVGLYRLGSGGWPVEQAARRAVAGAGALLAAVTALVVAFQVHSTSRAYLACAAVAVAYWLVASRAAARTVLHRWRATGRGVSRVLVVGDGIGAIRYAAGLTANPGLGMTPVGVLGDHGAATAGMPRLGRVADLAAVLTREVVDEVVICLPFEQWATVRDCAQIAEEQGKTVRIPLWMAEDLRGRSRVDEVAGVPLLSVTTTPDDVLQIGWKRAIDVVGALVGLAVFALPLLVAVVAIKRHDGGPVLFNQVRVGRHGREFRLLKLRTMSVDAEDRLAEVAHLNEREGHAFKSAADPRITPVGRLLRKASIDEVPQFLNVLRGDMSLVGPRPPMPREVDLYDLRHRRRLSVKPGLTGLWQVSGRAESSFESWVDLDLQYIDTWTPVQDLRILARTIPAVLKATGV